MPDFGLIGEAAKLIVSGAPGLAWSDMDGCSLHRPTLRTPFVVTFLRDCWEKLERKAGLKRVKGRGWHSLRRKFATDLKETPLAALCYLGGWKDAQTV
jgi:hypothetical protein